MKRLVASFFGVTFSLVVIQIAIIGFVALTGNLTLTEAMQQATIYDVREIQIGNQTQFFYLFNIRTYASNIEDSITVNMAAFNLDTPLFPKWKWTSVLSGLKTIANMLSYVINWLILLVNGAVLLPTKILLSPIIFTIAVLGIDVSKIGLLNGVQQIFEFNISYIPYLT